jgi:hypothetical protein
MPAAGCGVHSCLNFLPATLIAVATCSPPKSIIPHKQLKLPHATVVTEALGVGGSDTPSIPPLPPGVKPNFVVMITGVGLSCNSSKRSA